MVGKRIIACLAAATAVAATACAPKQPKGSPIDDGSGHADAGEFAVGDSGAGMLPLVADASPRAPTFVADSGTDFGGGIRGTALSTDRIDLLFVIDNSISMADKQDLFKQAVPDLLQRLANPICFDAGSDATAQPASADEPCPAGMQRQFKPVRDMHVGMISSSLGGFGGDICDSGAEDDDHAHLVGSLARYDGPSYRDLGFLAWDPGQAASPPGEDDLTQLVRDFKDQVSAIGEHGCGFEATLESWYRFLADPEPPETIEVGPCSGSTSSQCATPTGVDQAVLAQRAAFLRPDSTLVIMMLTDEDDCSVVPRGQLFYVARSNVKLPRASSTCAADPNDPCCYSCGQGPPAGCAPDPVCDDPQLPDDNINLRCYREKERFGIDFLQPIDRYLTALTEPELPNGQGEMVENPIYSDLSGSGAASRKRGNVFLVGIVGVPWQDLATAATLDAAGQLELKRADELASDGTWNLIVGDPDHNVSPSDPLMIPSVAPRGGTQPVTGEPLAGPSAGYLENSINGHEWENPDNNDLQYSCVFELPTPRDCATLDPETGCDCRDDPSRDKDPLCQAPDGSYGTVQRFAKAYPPPRILTLLERLGNTSVVASICPKNTSDPSAEDFGYRPVLGSIVRDVAEQLVR